MKIEMFLFVLQQLLTSSLFCQHFSGKYADTFEGFLRRHKGQEEVEFHVKRKEGENVPCGLQTLMIKACEPCRFHSPVSGQQFWDIDCCLLCNNPCS